MDDDHATAGDGRDTLDLRGLRCPMPVLRTRRALARLRAGRLIVVRCTDPLAELDIPNLLRETGDTLVAAARDGTGSRFTIRKGRGRPGAADGPAGSNRDSGR